MGDDIKRKVMNTKSVVDDVIHSVLQEVTARLIDREVSKVLIKGVMDSIREDMDLGTVPVRKRPEPRGKAKKTKNSSFETIMEKTRKLKGKEVKWEECSDLEGIPSDMNDNIYTEDPSLKLEEDTAIMAMRRNDDIWAMCVFNTDFDFRPFTEKEAKLLRSFGINIEEANIE